jgi:hypothetical protein
MVREPLTRTGRIVDTSQRAAEDAMPWSETNVVEQRMQFVMEWKKSETTLTSPESLGRPATSRSSGT